MLINVTQEHIDKGQKSTCGRCPVALALIDAGHKRVRVDGVNVRTLEHLRIRLPGIVSMWIAAFDFGHNVNPFSFELEIPAC